MRRNHTEASLKAIDADAARLYLAGIRALVREALETDDSRVLLGALEVLARQDVTVRELFRGKV